MGWEVRNGRSYYYRKERIGSRVVSHYIGSGQMGLFLAWLDAVGLEESEAKRAEELRAREETEIGEAHAAILGEVCETLTMAALLAEGFHTHKRQWRRARWR